MQNGFTAPVRRTCGITGRTTCNAFVTAAAVALTRDFPQSAAFAKKALTWTSGG